MNSGQLSYRTLFLILLFNLFVGSSSLLAQNSIKIGVLSYRGETESIESWKETAEYLSEQIPNYQFEIILLSYNEMEAAIIEKKIDLLVCNPANYILYEKRYGIDNIATLQTIYQGKAYHEYGSVFFTRKENLAINRLTQLKGKKIALVDRLSMGGCLLPQELLQNEGLDLIKDAKTLIYTHNQDDVVNTVLDEQADVGVVRTGVIEEMVKQGKIHFEDIKIIHAQSYPDFPFLVSSDLIPEWPLTKLKHVSDGIALDIVRELYMLSDQNLLKKSNPNIGWTLPSDYSIVYKKLKKIHAPPFESVPRSILENISTNWYFFFLIFSLVIVFTLFIIFSRIIQKQLHRKQNKKENNGFIDEHLKEGDPSFFSDTKSFAARCARKEFEVKNVWSWSYFKWFIVVAIGYFLTVRFGLLFSIGNTGNTAVWFAAGFGFMAVYALGYRISPALFLGALMVNIFPTDSSSILADSSTPLILASLNSINNTFEAVLGVYLVRRFIGNNPLFSSIRSTVSFIIMTALLVSLLSAFIGTLNFFFFSNHGYFYSMLLSWWFGDAAGLILVVPLVLSWKKLSYLPSKIKQISLLIIFVAMLILVGLFIFQIGYHISYLFLPFFIYFTFRFGRFLSLAMAMILGLVSNYVVSYLNIYWLWDTPAEGMFYVRLFILILLFTILLVAAVLDEQFLAEERMRLYKKIVENSNEGIAIIDLQGHYLEQNPAHRILVGFTDEELRGQTPAIHLGEEAFNKIASELTEKKLSVGEWTSNTKHGQVPIGLSAFSVANEDNEVICHVGIKRDISEHKKAENILRESEAEAWGLFKYAAIPIMIEDFSEIKIYLNKLIAAGLTDWEAYFEQNPKEIGKIAKMVKVIDVNKRMVDFYGKGSREELLKNIGGFFTDDSLSVFKDEIITLAKGGHAFTSEIPVQNIQGEAMHSIISLSIPPLYRQRLERVLVSFVDITQNKRAEKIQQTLLNISNAANKAKDFNETLQAVSTELSSIIDTSNFFLALYDENKDELNLPFIRDINNLPAKVDADKTLTSLVIKNQTPLLFKQKEIEEMEAAGMTNIVGAIAKVWLGVPLKIKGETIGAFVFQSYTNENAYNEKDKETLEIIANQIALSIERKKAEQDILHALEKAQESDHIKSAFLASMSHELRTPLNAIIGFSNLMDIDLPMEQVIQFAEMIYKSGTNLLQIVDSIFEVSLIDEGEQKVVLVKYSLEQIMNDVYHTILTRQKVLNKTGINIQMINHEPVQLEVYTDVDKLKNIFVHLLNNALKFTHSGSIHFGLDHIDENKRYHFYVFDTGIGIQKEKQAFIFDRFRMGDDTHTREYEGMGIGLFICKKLVEMLGGHIEVSSEENEGTHFKFYVPLHVK